MVAAVKDGGDMPAPKKLSALEAFEVNMTDARRLVAIANALTNNRQRRMRRELRLKVGMALGLRARDVDALDCIESDDLFVTLLPTSRIERADLHDMRPLLRQSIVAACAATETYMADRTLESLKGRLNVKEAPPKVRAIQVDVETWLRAESKYQRRSWAVREAVERHIREMASSSSRKVGELMSVMEVDKWAKKVDSQRGVASRQTERDLDRITERRNRIAHQGDRVGRGRAQITIEEATVDIGTLSEIVHAIEVVTRKG